jgi:hypothetical protein
MARTS